MSKMSKNYPLMQVLGYKKLDRRNNMLVEEKQISEAPNLSIYPHKKPI